MEWNTHMMRKNKRAQLTGKPDMMWSCPHAYGNYRKYLYPVTGKTIEHLHTTFAEEDYPNGVSEDIEAHFHYIMDKFDLKQPETPDGALSLYRNLTDKVCYFHG